MQLVQCSVTRPPSSWAQINWGINTRHNLGWGRLSQTRPKYCFQKCQHIHLDVKRTFDWDIYWLLDLTMSLISVPTAWLSAIRAGFCCKLWPMDLLGRINQQAIKTLTQNFLDETLTPFFYFFTGPHTSQCKRREYIEYHTKSVVSRK